MHLCQQRSLTQICRNRRPGPVYMAPDNKPVAKDLAADALSTATEQSHLGQPQNGEQLTDKPTPGCCTERLR